MKKSRITLLSIFLVIIVSVSGFFLLKDKNNDQSKEANKEVVLGEKQDKTITYENGDFIYTPTDEEIGYDSEEGILFYESMLNIFLAAEVSNEQAEDLANVVNGDVVGKMQGSINMLQIQVEEKELNELNRLADQLMEEELVKFAGSSTPSFISDLNATDDKQEDPDGDDWWAEAINAHSAWDYMDDHGGDFEKPVTVSVLETGKLGEKDGEFKDKSLDKDRVRVSPSSAKDAEYKTMGKSGISHAELVTKIIAGKENSQTIRGVAYPIVDIEFGSIQSGEIILENLERYNKNSVSEAEVISGIKASEQNNDITIINNSWGSILMSRAKWNIDEGLFKSIARAGKDGDYEEYKDDVKDSNDEVSVQLIIALDEFLENGEEDFLIIQGAGNGYSQTDNEDWDEDTSIEVDYSGYFANINEDTYNAASDLVGGKLNNKPEEILSHTIIVGGAVQTEGKDGYQSPAWASYGDAIDIAAPAEDLFIGSFKGTSFAAPMVSGAAAIIKSHNPEIKASEIKELLLNSAEYNVEDQRGDNTYSYPMLNMMAFLYGQYNELIEIYRTAISEQWEQSELDEKDLGPSHYAPHPLSADYGYELRDINGDAIPELVLGLYREDGSAEVNEIYTLQDKKTVKVFVNGIRTNINIYKDGTISETYGDRSMGYYKLNNDGTEELEEGFKIDHYGKYKNIIDSDESLIEADIEAMYEKYNAEDIIEHSFTPFVLEKETDEVVKKDKKERGLSNDEMNDIMRENYKKLEEILLEPDDIGELYDRHHKIEDAQKIWESGIDPNSPFYEDMYDLLYPKVKNLVAEEGMESFINVKYGMFWQPPATITFFGPEYDLEVLEKDSERFKLKQTKEIPPHEKGGEYYDLVYFIEYVKEANEWKLAGAAKQK